MRTPVSAFLALVIAVAPAGLRAQTVDTAIVGTVTDRSGAVIPGAKVTVTSVSTGIAKSAVTTATGEYTVNYLPPGSYNVEVTANGFTTTRQQAIELQLSQQARVNFQLQVGAATEQVTVQGAPPLLQTEASSLGTVVGEVETQNLPLNGRKFEDLAILTPGTTAYSPDNHTSSEDGASVQSYSEQLEWGQTNVDGVTMIGNRHAYVNLYPSTDAIQEFEVISANAEAQNVGAAGDITNIQLKSGTNNFHGDVFEYFRNTALDARNYFVPAPAPKQVYRQNQFGGTLGGPIIPNRTFFFVSYEGIRSNEQTAGLTQVLTPQEENGDFSALLPGTQLVSPSTGQPYLNNQIPVDPVAQADREKIHALAQYQPGRLQLRLFHGGHPEHQPVHRAHRSPFEPERPAYAFISCTQAGTILSPRAIRTSTIMRLCRFSTPVCSMFTSPRPSSSMNFAWGSISRTRSCMTTYANTNFTPASIGINGFVQPNGQPWPPSEQGFPNLTSNELIGVGSDFGVGLDQGKTYQLVDNVTWTHGTHTVIFGGDVRRVQDNADTSNTPYGVINFNGSETANNGPNAPANEGGFDGADLMLGIPSQVITPEGIPLTNAHQWRMFFYIQHNWKVTPQSYPEHGAELLPLPRPDELSQHLRDDGLDRQPCGSWCPSRTTARYGTSRARTLGPGWGSPIACRIRWWCAEGTGSVTTRGSSITSISCSSTRRMTRALVCSTATAVTALRPTLPRLPWQNPVSPSLSASVANIVSIPPGRQHPDLYLQTWNLTFSKQFWNNVIDVSYVGVKGSKEDTSLLNFNVGPPQAPGGNVQANRPYPAYGQMRVLDNHGASIYEGFLVHFQHRLSNGLLADRGVCPLFGPG